MSVVIVVKTIGLQTTHITQPIHLQNLRPWLHGYHWFLWYYSHEVVANVRGNNHRRKRRWAVWMEPKVPTRNGLTISVTFYTLLHRISACQFTMVYPWRSAFPTPSSITGSYEYHGNIELSKAESFISVEPKGTGVRFWARRKTRVVMESGLCWWCLSSIKPCALSCPSCSTCWLWLPRVLNWPVFIVRLARLKTCWKWPGLLFPLLH